MAALFPRSVRPRQTRRRGHKSLVPGLPGRQFLHPSLPPPVPACPKSPCTYQCGHATPHLKYSGSPPSGDPCIRVASGFALLLFAARLSCDRPRHLFLDRARRPRPPTAAEERAARARARLARPGAALLPLRSTPIRSTLPHHTRIWFASVLLVALKLASGRRRRFFLPFSRSVLCVLSFPRSASAAVP